MASSSSSSCAFDAIIPSASTFVAYTSGMKHPPFDVFINHRGQDVKHTLASRIYESLDATGLKVFLDKDELKYGDLLPKALQEAMSTASICIAVFSEHYAQSPWCLTELEYMVKTGKMIIPIFYHVQPYDLKWAVEGKGAYAEAFSKHEKKNRYALDVLQRWKRALHEASFCTGGTINNIDDEEKEVKKVVYRVMEKMDIVPLEVAKHPVGLDEAVQDFYTCALQSAGPIRTVGIWGMGGSGKTTLAKEIFNRRRSNMDWSSFLSDVRDAAGKGQLLEKQKTLLKDLGFKTECPDNLDKGKQILKYRLSRSVSVLIVLDDVDHIDQLDALLPPKESFEYSLADQSLIIVTTRDADVLQQWRISATHQMKTLKAAHAKQLFCWHAFKQDFSPSEFEDLVEKFLNACGGLPLALKVLGGLLCGKSDREYWLETLKKVSNNSHADIKKILKISYDALEKEEKEMFLDAACLFIGERRSAAIAAWDAGTVGWYTLFSKCLVEEDEKGLIRMHDHLRDLGREIANGHSPYRLWSPEQIIEIPPQQEAIRVRGVASAVGRNCYHRQGKIIIKANQEEYSFAPWLGLKIFLGNGEIVSQELSHLTKELIWLQCEKFEHENLPPWLALKKLRILDLSHSDSLEHLWAQDADAPLELRELVIRSCNSLTGFPNSIDRLRNLRRISLNGNHHYSSCDKLRDLPQKFCRLQSLEHLELRNCTNLSSLPSNFGKLTQLRHLDLEFCTKLEALPDSFEKLTLLKYLTLRGCRGLAIKSESNVLENMTNLRYLNLDGCMKLEDLRLPESVSLTELYLTNTSLKELPANIFYFNKLTKLEIGIDFLKTLPTSVGNLSPLTALTIRGCKQLESLADSVEHLSRLTTLKISICRQLESLPDSLEHLSLLRDLTIQSTGVKCLPKSLIHLQSLRIASTPVSELSFRSWCMLKSIILSGTKVSKISLGGDSCPALETLDLYSNDDLRELETLPEKLKTLKVRYCNVLRDIGGVSGLKELKSLEICGWNKELDGLPCFAELASLETFTFNGCSKVKRIAGLEKLRSLRELSIEIDELPSFAEYTSLRKLVLQHCNKLEKIESLGYLKSLEELNISHCSELKALSSLQGIISLKTIQLVHCSRLEKVEGSASLKKIDLKYLYILENVDGLENIRSLETLVIHSCPKLAGLPGLAKLTALRNLELRWCNKLEKIESLEHLESLQWLTISDCPELEVLPSLPETASLKAIQLERCHKLEKVKGLEKQRSLEKLKIYLCPRLDELFGLAELTYLKKFDLQGCSKLKKIESLEHLKSLEKIKIRGCLDLQVLPSLPKTSSLKEFQLERCRELEQVGGLENIISLEKLTISGCPKLDRLPDLAKLRLLKELKITDCPELEAIAGHSETAITLKEIHLEKCHKLERIEGLKYMRSLKKLMIHDCPELNELPGLAELISLQKIDLQMCHNLKKIEDLENTISLEKFIIRDCQKLEALPSLPKITSQQELQLEKCHKLKKIKGLENIKSLHKLSISDCQELDGFSDLGDLTSLKEFALKMCPKLGKMDGLEKIRSLEKIKISDCQELDGILCLAELASLKELDLLRCNELEKIEGLENLRSLESVQIYDCPQLDGLLSLAELPAVKRIYLGKCPKLEKLKIYNCPQLNYRLKLEEFSSLKEFELQRCPKLAQLDISDCPKLDGLPSLAELPCLERIHLRNCPKLIEIEGLEDLRVSDSPKLAAIKITSLQAFELKNCCRLEKIECWKHFKSLEELTLSDCSELEVLSSLAEMESLKYFHLEKCSKLKKIEGLENTKSLEMLKISDCSELEALPETTSLKTLELGKWHMKIEGFRNMISLESLTISDCSELETLPEITSLKVLELNKCSKLKKMEGLGNMVSLEKLTISDCLELESLPNLSEITSLRELRLENCYKVEKIEGLERLRRLSELKVHTRWNAPCIVSLEHFKRLWSLDVVANDISAVGPFISNCNTQTWPWRVMICTRQLVGEVGLLKSFFQDMPNVSVVDYISGVEADQFHGKCLEFRAPAGIANADAIGRCFIIDSNHPDLRLSIECFGLYSDFSSELGEGKWVWMGVSRVQSIRSSLNEDYIYARDSEGKDVKVSVEAAWLVTGKEESIVEAYVSILKGAL